MLFRGALVLCSLVSTMAAAPNAWPFDVTEIKAPDGSISAKFVSVGATLTELWVKDRDGKARDVVLGYDDNTQLLKDQGHPVFNSIVGRYAGRLNGGLFSIPISKNPDPKAPNTYHIPTNDGGGKVTLHGGIIGWDRRNWTLEAKTDTSVTYKHIDKADEGFPGTVTVFATHTVTNNGTLRTKINATASEKTPIMLTQHVYWNLDAFEGSDDVLNHELSVAASRQIDTNELSIPTGKFVNVAGTPSDFRKSTKIGARWNQTVNLCGSGCQGYNAGWIYDDVQYEKPQTSLKSDRSGIKLDIRTDQPATVVYSAWWLSAPRKAVHGGPSLSYSHTAAVALEQQGYIDAINTPEWGIDQIYDPNRDYHWRTEYKFSNF